MSNHPPGSKPTKATLARVRRRIQAHVRWLQRIWPRSTVTWTRRSKPVPLWRAQEDLLRQVPGVGQVLIHTLLAQLPESGTLSRQQVATLVGVAPLNRDSGTWQGRRGSWGGRGAVRAVRYMATLTATHYPGPIRTSTSGCVGRANRRKWSWSRVCGSC